MKTSTLRLAHRLAAKVELDAVQRSLMEEAFGVHDWGGMFFDDQFTLRDLAQKRREQKHSTSAKAERSASTGDDGPLDCAGSAHGVGHPVARDIDIGDLALCLMVLPGLVATGAQALVAALSAAQPIVAVRGNVRGFERRFTGLLESLVRTKRRPLRVVHLDDPSELGQKHRIKTTEIVALQIGSEALDGATPAQIRRCLMTAMRAQTPIVVTSETPGTDFPVHIASALDITIDAAPLNWPLLAELIDAKTGIAADAVLAAASNHAIDLTRLSLDDLALAIRPGRKLEVILATLAQIAAAPADEPSDDDGNAKNRKTTSSSRNRNGTAGTGSVRIDPQPLPAAVTPETQTPNIAVAIATPPDGDPDVAADETGHVGPADGGSGGVADATPAEKDGPALPSPESTSAAATDIAVPVAVTPASEKAAARPAMPRARSTPVVSVETLAGYGKARDWALDLKTDLAAWKAGTVLWSDLSSKLLLSGPPGTGKTTFARALGNTLQLPVFATSVATWLEASHLGDVLKRMRDCFEEAGHAISVLTRSAVPPDQHIVTEGLPRLPAIGIGLELADTRPSPACIALSEHVRAELPDL